MKRAVAVNRVYGWWPKEDGVENFPSESIKSSCSQPKRMEQKGSRAMDKIKRVANISIALDFRVITIFMPVVCYTWHKISVSKCKRTRHKEQKERIKHKQIKVIMMQSCMFPKWSAFSSFSHIRTHTHTNGEKESTWFQIGKQTRWRKHRMKRTSLHFLHSYLIMWLLYEMLLQKRFFCSLFFYQI